MNKSRRFHHRQTILTWLTVFLLVLLQAQFLPTFSVSQSQLTPSDTDHNKSAVQANYGKLPLAFEPNQGQADGGAQFLVHHGQATTYFDGANTTTSVGDDHVTMILDGANTPNFTGTDQLESKTNYFIGNDRSKWHSDVPNYKQLLAKNVYPGIDLKYYGTNSQLEHDFIVSPGSDYGQISFHFDGQQDLSLDKDGNLILKTQNDELQLKAPTTYQQTSSLTGESKHTISSQFELKDNTVTVALNGEYDHSQSLVIDPVLAYSTYLGGTGSNVANAIAVDSNGDIYIAGQTTSAYPTSTPFQGTYGGGAADAIVTKMNAAGTALTYSTYLGGSGNDLANAITVDSSGNAYVTGTTSVNVTNFPTTVGAFDTSHNGGSDVFITKLNATGSALTFSTFLGGSVIDEGYGIAIDSSGNVYVTGGTQSTNFPTSSPFQGTKGFGGDVFAIELNAAGTALMYSTYIGGNASDEARDIALDSSGNAYITGWTTSTDFPTSSPFQASNAGNSGGGGDAFSLKLNPAGSALIYSTYLGGSGADRGVSIAVDMNGNAYLGGTTNSTNYPTSSPFQASNAGGFDVFVTKLNAAGSALTYSTYLGGSSTEASLSAAIAIDTSGNAYLTGSTQSTDFPISAPYQSSHSADSGNTDVFVTKLNTSGSALTYSTYLGGTSNETGQSIAIGLNGNAYIAGYTGSTDFPTVSPYQASKSTSNDIFIAQLSESTVNLTAQVDPTLSFTVGSTNCVLGALSVSQTKSCTYALTASTNGTSGYIISYLPVATLTSGANTITALSALTASTLNTEQFGINLRANTAVGSHTAGAFGADVSGGSGTVAGAYNTADSFKLVAAGDTVSSSASPSLASTYTVSTIANIGATTEAGAYTTTLTYNIVAGY